MLLLSEGKLKKGEFRLARVCELHPGEDGVVRTVTIALRDRRKRGERPVVRKLPMAVQRLAVLLAVEESWSGGLLEPSDS